MVIGVGLFALVLAACSKGSGNDGGQPAGGGQPAASQNEDAMGSASATVAATEGDLGTMLVDDEGRTLYLFLADKGPSSTCDGDCASNWPALTVSGQPSAGDGVDDSALGTTDRPDGTTQVTFDGHPLYTFAGDQAAGDTNGQGIGDLWYVVSPGGTPIKGSAGSGARY
jgi:predicted lipoprotein with Yx(FWY)xxD motif